MQARQRVLILDCSEQAGLLADLLRAEGFEPIVRGDAVQGLAAFQRLQPVAVFLGWALPDRSAFEVCREVRAMDRLAPIIFISGQADEATVSSGLDAGADDFITRPMRAIELTARLEAHQRKAHAIAALSKPGERRATLVLGEIEIDRGAREVRALGELVRLGQVEFALLEYLALNRGQAVSRGQIMDAVYGYPASISTERVDMVVRRLRRKLGEGPGRGGLLVAVPGYGYRFGQRQRI